MLKIQLWSHAAIKCILQHIHIENCHFKLYRIDPNINWPELSSYIRVNTVITFHRITVFTVCCLLSRKGFWPVVCLQYIWKTWWCSSVTACMSSIWCWVQTCSLGGWLILSTWSSGDRRRKISRGRPWPTMLERHARRERRRSCRLRGAGVHELWRIDSRGGGGGWRRKRRSCRVLKRLIDARSPGSRSELLNRRIVWRSWGEETTGMCS